MLPDINPQMVIGAVVLIGIVYLYMKSTKKPAAVKKQSPPTPAELEREELVVRAAERTRTRHLEAYNAEMDAKLDALNAPSALTK